MITASHNPIEYNGFKIFDSRGESLEDSNILSRSTEETERQGAREMGLIQAGNTGDYTQLLSSIKLKKEWRSSSRRSGE